MSMFGLMLWWSGGDCIPLTVLNHHPQGRAWGHSGGSVRMGGAPAPGGWEQDSEGWMDGSSRVHTAQCKGRGESVGGHLYSGPLPQERAEKEPAVTDSPGSKLHFWPRRNRPPLIIRGMSIYQQRYLYLFKRWSMKPLWWNSCCFIERTHNSPDC